MKNLTFTEIQEQINLWIEDVNFDLQQDWNEEKEKMFFKNFSKSYSCYHTFG